MAAYYSQQVSMSLMDMELDIGVDLDNSTVLKPPWGFEDSLNIQPPTLPTAAPPLTKPSEKQNTLRRNGDQKANLSVKDKIAMFASLEDVSMIKQNEPSPPPCFVDLSPFSAALAASKEKEDTGYSSWEKDRDSLGGCSSSTIPNIPPPPKPEFQHWRSVTNLMVHDRPESSLSTSSTLSRSSDDLGNRYTSKMSMYPHTSSSDDTDQDPVVSGSDKEKKLLQRRSLYSLMESRMQTVSKLRGLVIPDAPRDVKDASVEHLPTIVTAVQVVAPPKTEFKSTLEMTPVAVSNKEMMPPPPQPQPRPAPRTNATFRKSSSESIEVEFPPVPPVPTSAPVASPRVVLGKERPALERAVSAPQIDADSEDSVRILKANSVEAINRMNVLRSAKTSSGARVALVDIAIEDAVDAAPRQVVETPQATVRVATITVVQDSDSEEEEEEEDMEEEEDEEEEEVVKVTKVSSMTLTTVAPVAVTRNLSDDGLDKKTNQVNEGTFNGVEAVPVPVPAPVPKAQVSSERWSQLEEKYGPKAAPSVEKRERPDPSNSVLPAPRMPSTLPRNLPGNWNGNGNENGNPNFRTIADKWQERASTEPSTTATLPRTTWKSENVPIAPHIPGRKLSAPLASAPVPVLPVVPVPTTRGVTMRDNNNRSRMSLAPRPASMVENGSDRKLKAWDPNNITANGSYLAAGRKQNTAKATSFGDLRQVFEKQESAAAPSVNNLRLRKVDNTEQHVSMNSRNNQNHYNNHARMSSLDSTASGDSDAPAQYSSANCLPSAVDHYGSVTSLSSSTSLISSQELQQLIDEANQSLEEFGSQCQEVMVVVLQRETLGGSVGVTLAGGADYDSKEITINRIIKGGLAEKDGRIQQGDRVISVNGKHLRGVTHKEALNILKAPRSDCVLVLSRNRTSSVGTDDGTATKSGDLITASKQKTVDTTVISNETVSAPVTTKTNGKCEVCLEIVKDGSGLGFSLDGGKQSPLGDKPLTIKKIFSDKGGVLKVGDEILSINDTDATNMARSEAWNFMRKLPDGVVKLVVRQSS